MPEILCPYCCKLYSDEALIDQDRGSDDHIFLDAIGGKRTIRACKGCNDVFGNSFEAHTVARNLHPLLLLLADAGVPIVDPGAHWKRAFVWEGQEYNFVLGPKGLVAQQVRPMVRRSPDNPKVLQVTIDGDEAGERHLEQFSHSNKLKFLKRTDLPQVVMKGLQFTFNMDREMKLTALKMGLALGMIQFPDETDKFSAARDDLKLGVKREPKCVEVDHRYHTTLDSLRKPLCHTIYVEQSESGIRALVQFFGSFQFWIALSSNPSSNSENGLLATLDPVTGEEEFRPMKRLNITQWHPDDLVVPFAPITKFNAGASARGAKTETTLRLESARCADGSDLPINKSTESDWSWTGVGPMRTIVKFY
jgi:hypothetical protein